MQIRIRADGFDGVMRMVGHGAGSRSCRWLPSSAQRHAHSRIALDEPWALHVAAVRDGFQRAAELRAKALLKALTLP